MRPHHIGKGFPLSRFIITRLIMAVPVLLGISLLVFLMLHLTPGDPVEIMLSDFGATPQQVAALRTELGLNDPLPIQYGRFLWNATHGDLGRSIVTRQPVITMIMQQLPSTLELTLAAMAMAIPLGILLGVFAAMRRNSSVDSLSMLFAMIGISIPDFWFGLILIYLFALGLGWLPATGQGGWERLVMPAVTLGLPAAAVIARLTRASMSDVLGNDYITTARAKGLAERVVLWRHALKNALIPVVTVVGVQIGALLAGAVVIETVFSRQGIGRLAVSSILAKDFQVVQGLVLLSATAYVAINVLVDILYGFIDPRVRYD